MSRPRCVIGLIFVAAVAVAAPPESQPEAVPLATPVDAEPKSAIVYAGQRFELAASTATAAVATDEYVMPGEKIGTWTQLLTVQRLTLAAAAATDEFVAFFKKRVAEDGATLEVLTPGKPASVFAVRFPPSERNEEQVMVCLAFADAAKPERLNIVQYAIKPARLPLGLVESRIRAWRDKFIAQANTLAAPSS